MLYRTPEPERKRRSGYRHPKETEALIVIAVMVSLCLISWAAGYVYDHI